MKVVFLDIDGVLNSTRWFNGGLPTNRTLGHIDPEAAARVQRLCDETGASIVVSSTWRLLHKRMALCDILGARGIIASILGVTPSTNRERGHDIQAWLNENERFRVDGMVIIDDDQDMVHLSPWLVRTTFFDGFTDSDIHRAKLILQKPMP